MKFARIYAVFLRQIFLIRSSFTRVVPLFAWVTIDVVLWGFVTRYLNSFPGTASSGVNFVASLLGVVLIWDFFIRVMQGVTMAFLEDVWSRNFLNLFASPLSLSEYVSGLVLGSIATSAIGLVIMLLVASAVFGLTYASYGFLFAYFLSVLFLFGIALGILACAIVLRLGPAAEWFVWPIPSIMSPFASVFYPLSVLPHWMQLVAHCLPPAYVFESMRAIVAGQPVPPHYLEIGLVLAALDIVLASLIFARTYRYVVRNGLIARYSAESVT